MVVYCLFCETEKCENIRKAMEDVFECRALYPKQMQHTWSRGQMVNIERALLPGYVFLYFDEEYPEVTHFRRIYGVIRCLRDTSRQYPLCGNSKAFAEMLLQQDGQIGKTPVYEEGQRIRICEGAFAGLESTILKVDRRASRMQVEIPFAGRNVKTWLEYEIVESREAKSETDELTPCLKNEKRDG